MVLKLRAVSPLPPFTFAPPSPPSSTGEPSTPPPQPPTNPTEFILVKDQVLFGAHPLATERGKGLLRCTKCSKIVTEAAASEHKRICAHVLEGVPLNNKKTVKKTETLKRRVSDGSDETDSPSKKKQKLPSNTTTNASSAVADDVSVSGDLPPMPSLKGMTKSDIKKLKKERERLEKKNAKQQAKIDAQERKRMRANEPIDLDRQCGVINDKNLPCSRSLTCKTHTVGAKRAVEGRSKPYDSLYLEWQRANNPNFKEPQKPGRKEKPEHDKSKKSGGGGGGGAGGGKKKWGAGGDYSLTGGDDEGIAEGEEGQRELEEIIAFARIAGQRCRTVVANFGSGWDTLPNGQPRGAKRDRKASMAPPAAAPAATATATNGTAAAPAAVTSTTAPATTAAATNPAIPPAPINKGTIPFSASSAFKAATIEYHGVGDMLTKALASRTPAAGHALQQGRAVSIANRGIPATMTTGGIKLAAGAQQAQAQAVGQTS